MRFGIDFGTTNSACVAIEERGIRPTNFTDGYGNPYPSLVIIDRVTGEVYTGREAWHRREELRESCQVITSVKRLLDSGQAWHIAGQSWQPEDVAGVVFGGLKESVIKRTGQDLLKEAVVAVPVGFSSGKRAALRRAAASRGINIESYVSEPTAALFHNYDEIGYCTRVGVFDWGGGTLDVSVIENRNGRVVELATDCIELAGDHIDRRMAEWMHARIAKKVQMQLSIDEMPAADRDKLLTACEQAKRELAWDDRIELQLLSYGDIEYVRESIDYETFALLIQPFIDRACGCFEDCVRRAGSNITDLDCIIMVGGSVNLRPLGEMIADSWEGKEYYPQESEWSVATGAASLSANPGEHLMAQSVGVVMSDGTNYPLVEAGKPLEEQMNSSAVFALVEEDPTACLVFADDRNNILGHMNVPAFGFFEEKIIINTNIDKDFILHVQAVSTNRSENTVRYWQCSDLRVNYCLPEMLTEVVKNE